MERSCDSCSACCKIPKIETPEFSKPLGQWCTHCKPGAGCTIYETRPQVCRDYRCAWLGADILPDAFRPDRLKVMFSFEPSPLKERAGKLCAVGRPLSGLGDFERPAVRDAIVTLIRAGFDVHLAWDTTKVRVVPHFDARGRLAALDMPDHARKAMRRTPLGPMRPGHPV